MEEVSIIETHNDQLVMTVLPENPFLQPQNTHPASVSTQAAAGRALTASRGSNVITQLTALTTGKDIEFTIPAQKAPEQTHPAGQKSGFGPGITIENWSATFSSRVGQPSLQDMATPREWVPGSGGNLAIDQAGMSHRQSVETHYLQANLPSGLEPVGRKTEYSEQNLQNQKDQPGSHDTLVRGIQMHSTAGEKNPALIFTLAQADNNPFSTVQAPGQTPATAMTQSTPGIHVPDNHIISQVVERFTLNQRLETGSIVLRLHPQELGELRMEIKVDQDNIRAHITTQNLHVQDVLEKNMPRLRDALELQGMNLEEVEVSIAASGQDSSTPDQGNPTADHQASGTFTRSGNTAGDFASLLDSETEPLPPTSRQGLSVHV
ncbi:flagellar hook-length control protein FliK [Desulfolithobacter sp.]